MKMKFYEFFDPKGYVAPDGYMGWTGRRYDLFATEEEYDEWYDEHIRLKKPKWKTDNLSGE